MCVRDVIEYVGFFCDNERLTVRTIFPLHLAWRGVREFWIERDVARNESLSFSFISHDHEKHFIGLQL